MRVLHVIARLNVGGTARYITQLANELPKHGIETFVATGFVQGAEVEDPSAQSIDLIRIPAMGRSIRPIKDHFARKQLEKIIQEVKPDIIHTHTFKAGYVIRMKQQVVPVVHTFHGHLLDDPEFSGFKSKLIVALERKFAKKSAKLVTVGRRVADELLEQQIGTRNQFVNIPPGVVAVNVTTKAQALKNLNLEDNGAPIVGWIARVTGVKNPMRALEVADALPDTRFVMAGGGDLLEQVKAKAPANVSVIGWAEAADLFGASDIILSTSENEGMPVALIEAQLAGKPVVATDVGSVSEVILNHETGIVTNKNAGSIASAVESLMLDKTTRDEMGRLAIARAQALFSVDRMINAHIELYKSIVKYQVTLLDNFSTGSKSNIAHLDGKVTTIDGDIRNTELIDQLTNDADLVLHMAAALGVNTILESPLESMSTNITGSEVVLNAAAKHNKRIIIASTSEIYGKNTKQPLSETDDRVVGAPQKIRWTYSDAKAIEEAMAFALHQEKKLPVTTVRLFNTVGPRQTGRYGMVVPRFVQAALKNEALTIYGDGTQSRVFCHVADAVQAIVTMAANDATIGDVYNVGGTGEVTIKQLAEQVLQLVGRQQKI
jgi:UDP-glucose 4-epimerase